jgi:hypothetical protein
MSKWPLPWRVPAGASWDELLARGKDGLFIIVMTLAWWSKKQAKTEDEYPHLDKAIADLSWVLSKLILVLSVDDFAPSQSTPTPRHSSPPMTSATAVKHKAKGTLKLGPLRKHARASTF